MVDSACKRGPECELRPFVCQKPPVREESSKSLRPQPQTCGANSSWLENTPRKWRFPWRKDGRFARNKALPSGRASQKSNLYFFDGLGESVPLPGLLFAWKTGGKLATYKLFAVLPWKIGCGFFAASRIWCSSPSSPRKTRRQFCACNRSRYYASLQKGRDVGQGMPFCKTCGYGSVCLLKGGRMLETNLCK